jgi:hypothetical protein
MTKYFLQGCECMPETVKRDFFMSATFIQHLSGAKSVKDRVNFQKQY